MKETVAYLNSNDGRSLLALGETDRIRVSGSHSMRDFEAFLLRTAGKYRFGVLSYDFKDALHGLSSRNEDVLVVPDLIFWAPECVVRMDHETISFLQGEKTELVLERINALLEEETNTNFRQHDFRFEPKLSREQYLEKVTELQKHIQRGDIYEVNFCQEYLVSGVEIQNLWNTYFKLNQMTHAPHSAFVHVDEFALFCASPERFLKKEGERLISQPIKGTAPRSPDSEKDDEFRETLRNDPKERAENVMIVDLVRNDLSQVAKKNSVNVDELCGIYTFQSVHQMISTISCELEEGVQFTDLLKATFPMGSMTGAPKIRAMELIDQFENFRRGFYSGSIGYISPNDDFDFNVVIRSMIYNSEKQLLSCAVGSAITIKSDPQKEFEECQVKIRHIIQGINE
jgi:para-aminobenzoate synthetase component 1